MDGLPRLCLRLDMYSNGGKWDRIDVLPYYECPGARLSFDDLPLGLQLLVARAVDPDRSWFPAKKSDRFTSSVRLYCFSGNIYLKYHIATPCT